MKKIVSLLLVSFILMKADGSGVGIAQQQQEALLNSKTTLDALRQELQKQGVQVSPDSGDQYVLEITEKRKLELEFEIQRLNHQLLMNQQAHPFIAAIAPHSRLFKKTVGAYKTEEDLRDLEYLTRAIEKDNPNYDFYKSISNSTKQQIERIKNRTWALQLLAAHDIVLPFDTEITVITEKLKTRAHCLRDDYFRSLEKCEKYRERAGINYSEGSCLPANKCLDALYEYENVIRNLAEQQTSE